MDKYEEAAEKKDVTCDHCMTTHPRQNPSCCEQYNDANTQVAALTASLASMTKERDRANWRADSNFENYEYEKQQRVALQFELAELRKRMEIARLALEKAEHGLIVTHNLDASDDPERGRGSLGVNRSIFRPGASPHREQAVRPCERVLPQTALRLGLIRRARPR